MVGTLPTSLAMLMSTTVDFRPPLPPKVTPRIIASSDTSKMNVIVHFNAFKWCDCLATSHSGNSSIDGGRRSAEDDEMLTLHSSECFDRVLCSSFSTSVVCSSCICCLTDVQIQLANLSLISVHFQHPLIYRILPLNLPTL